MEDYCKITHNFKVVYVRTPYVCKSGNVRGGVGGLYLQEECSFYINKVGFSEFSELNKIIVEISGFNIDS